jgi:hypothetical protein
MRFPPDLAAICKALVTRSAAACKAPDLEVETVASCMASLAATRYLADEITAAQLASDYRGALFAEAIEAGRFVGRDCSQLALELFDRAAVAHFLVQPGWLGLLPRFP